MPCMHNKISIGLHLSWVSFLSVDFLEKWDQCVINVPKAESFSSMPLTPGLRVPACLQDTGAHGKLKVRPRSSKDFTFTLPINILKMMMFDCLIDLFSVTAALSDHRDIC